MLDLMDSTVRCLECGCELRVSFAQCLARGWPKCHDQTMRLMTSPTAEQIDAAVGAIIEPAKRLAARWT